MPTDPHDAPPTATLWELRFHPEGFWVLEEHPDYQEPEGEPFCEGLHMSLSASFGDLLAAFRELPRGWVVPGTCDWENVAEQCWQLAVVHG